MSEYQPGDRVNASPYGAATVLPGPGRKPWVRLRLDSNGQVTYVLPRYLSPLPEPARTDDHSLAGYIFSGRIGDLEHDLAVRTLERDEARQALAAMEGRATKGEWERDRAMGLCDDWQSHARRSLDLIERLTTERDALSDRLQETRAALALLQSGWRPLSVRERARVEAECSDLREKLAAAEKALWRCVELSGADTSDGIPTWPALPDLAIEEVGRLRAEHDEVIG